MSAHLLTGVRPYGEDAADILLVDGAIAAVGPDAAERKPPRHNSSHLSKSRMPSSP